MVLERYSGKNNIALCCSEPIRKEIHRYFGYDAHVMWYPIDLNHFRRLDTRECRRQLGIESEAVGLYVGSSHPMKGFGAVEQIARKFPELTMLVAVRGPLPERSSETAERSGISECDYDVLPTALQCRGFFHVSLALRSLSVRGVRGARQRDSRDRVAARRESDLLHGRHVKPLLTASTDDLEGFEKAVRDVILRTRRNGADLIQAKVRRG